MPELAHFPAYVRTGCVRTYAAIDPKHAYRRDKRKRQGTTAMVIPCLCSFLLTVLSSASAGTCRGEAPPSCCARPFCRLKAPLGLSLLRYTPQPRTSRKQKTYPNPFSERIGFGYELYGGRYRTRTCDLLHVKQMLYQLS